VSVAVELEVEGTLRVRGTAYVFARVLEDGGNFTFCRGSTLSGIPLQPYLDIPRAVDANGRPRLDLFAFALQDPADAAHFEVGQRVELSTPG
jgi:hypothetical protein